MDQVKQNNINYNQLIDRTLLLLTVVSTFLFPRMVISEAYPAFRLEDILLVPIVIRLIQLKPKIDSYIKLICGFALYIFIVILINGRIGCVRDYFEICKLLKLMILILFFSASENIGFIKKMFVPVFMGIVVFNLFQYFNILNFNAVIEPFYSPEHHLKYFGLNSDFTIGTKRLLGTMGNPNNNGILFLFFIVYFLPTDESKVSKWQMVLFVVAIYGCIHTQSRTAFITLLLILTVYTIVRFAIVKRHYMLFLALLMVVLTEFYYDNLLYLGSLRGTKIQQDDNFEFKTNNHSLQTRFEIWQHLYKMIQQKPLMGHAPYKEYFYEHQLYSENEYILMIWRYGIIGLCFFTALIFYPAFKAYRSKFHTKSMQLMVFTFCIMLTALTNNPLSEPRILIMFALMVGLFYAEMDITGNHQQTINR